MELTPLIAHATAALDWLWPPVCARCEARAEAAATRFCDACWAGLRPLGRHDGQGVLAAFAVDSFFLDALAAGKYRRQRPVLMRLARTAARRVESWLPRGTPIVPVPLAPDKQRERGFNQAEIFGRELAARLEAPLIVDALVRVRGGKAIAGTSRTERAGRVRGAFRAGPGLDPAREGSLLLVDDLVTTGSTSADCLRALTSVAPALDVRVVAMGRAFGPREDAPPIAREGLARL
ncbi:MAG: ComF family protein [Gemmatimonadetes bacterium]|nr:ComF family protein [Gemmatimonadota bacterium]